MRCAALLAVLLAASCGPVAEADWEVKELDLPSDTERQASLDLREARRLVGVDDEVRAEPLLRRVLEARPRSLEAHLLLATVLEATRRRPAAIEALRTARDLDPKGLEVHKRLSELLFSMGELPAAQEAYLAWEKANPRSSEAPFGLGRVLYARGDYPGAMRALRNSEKLKRARADVRSELGLVLHAMGKLDKAEEKQRDALERDPNFAIAWFRLGAVISGGDDPLDRIDEAIEALANAVRLKPRMPDAHLYLFRLHRLAAAAGREGHAEAAQKSFGAVLGYHRKEALAGLGLGARPKYERNLRAQEKRLRKEAEHAAGDASAARLALGRFLHGRERFDEALEQYQTILTLHPEQAEARALAGAAHLHLRDLDAAESDLREAVRVDRTREPAWRSLAWVLLRRGKDAEAIAAYDEVLRFKPGDLRAHKGRGLARMHAGELDAGFHEIANAGWIER